MIINIFIAFSLYIYKFNVETDLKMDLCTLRMRMLLTLCAL